MEVGVASSLEEDAILLEIHEFCHEMRASFADLRRKFGEITQRLDDIEDEQQCFLDELTARAALRNAVFNSFDKRLSGLERNVETLMKGK